MELLSFASTLSVVLTSVTKTVLFACLAAKKSSGQTVWFRQHDLGNLVLLLTGLRR